MLEVCIYLRWARWLLTQLARTGQYVIVNMDETRLDNQTQWRHGCHARRMTSLGVTPELAAAATREERRTFIAALANDATTQAHLPQILLTEIKKRRGPDSHTDPLAIAQDSVGKQD